MTPLAVSPGTVSAATQPEAPGPAASVSLGPRFPGAVQAVPLRSVWPGPLELATVTVCLV